MVVGLQLVYFTHDFVAKNENILCVTALDSFRFNESNQICAGCNFYIRLQSYVRIVWSFGMEGKEEGVSV